MSAAEVVVVGETPSLGRSIVDLLRAAGIPCRWVVDLTAGELETGGGGPDPVVVVACNESFCRTARRWARGELGIRGLVVVGSRDPQLAMMPGLRVIPLPLQADPFLALTRSLLGAAGPAVRAASGAQGL
jgi:hypothetical protein